MNSNFKILFDKFNNIHVGVIGDVMLDSYVWGNVDRISPEAPVPIVTLKKKELRLGGAGNVALNCKSLGSKVSVLSVCGNDVNGVDLIQLFNDNQINTKHIIKSDKRITTNKTRIISRNQQMLRLDAEMNANLNTKEEEKFIEEFKDYTKNEKPHIIIFEDYNKGVLTPKIIKESLKICKELKILTAIDPKRQNFLHYKNADIFKPNLKEACEALHIHNQEVNVTTLNLMHQQLYKSLKHKISFITLSDKGVFYKKAKLGKIIPSHLRNIADVSGAGDTVIAVASLVYATTKNVELMAQMANIAGGLVCEDVGTVAINKNKFLQECNRLIQTNLK